MKKLILLIVILVIFIGILNLQKNIPTPKQIPTVSVAMDWTPNTNHTGIYVAMQKGWYKNEGISVKILPYSATVSPDVLVATDKADIGISSTEGVVADFASGNPVISIAAILEHNTSSLVALKDSGIKRPKDLDGKIYGGFGAPYENAVVSEIIKKDGGKGVFKNVTLDVDALQALESKKIDFVWIFDGWEGIQAKQQGLILISFPINSNGVPDYYTPVFITNQKEIKNNNENIKKFMHATQKGYEYAIDHPDESAQILINQAPKGTFPDTTLVFKSQEYLSKKYVDAQKPWGLQDKTYWQKYPQFMLDSGSISDKNGKPVKQMNFGLLFTNQFITQ